MIRREQLYEHILEQIDLTKETDDEELQELIRTVLDEAADVLPWAMSAAENREWEGRLTKA